MLVCFGKEVIRIASISRNRISTVQPMCCNGDGSASRKSFLCADPAGLFFSEHEFCATNMFTSLF